LFPDPQLEVFSLTEKGPPPKSVERFPVKVTFRGPKTPAGRARCGKEAAPKAPITPEGRRRANASRTTPVRRATEDPLRRLIYSLGCRVRI
jgi:hypothetical protein